MEITRDQLAAVLADVTLTIKGADVDFKGRHYGPLDVPEHAADLIWSILRQRDDVVDAHVCCEHAGTGDGELLAMAALMPALPMVSKLGHDARERVMDWARRRATDGMAPF